jgi:hypothetical protein
VGLTDNQEEEGEPSCAFGKELEEERNTQWVSTSSGLRLVLAPSLDKSCPLTNRYCVPGVGPNT